MIASRVAKVTISVGIALIQTTSGYAAGHLTLSGKSFEIKAKIKKCTQDVLHGGGECDDYETGYKIKIIGRKALVEFSTSEPGKGEIYEINRSVDIVADRSKSSFNTSVGRPGVTFTKLIQEARAFQNGLEFKKYYTVITSADWVIPVHPPTQTISQNLVFEVMVREGSCDFRLDHADTTSEWGTGSDAQRLFSTQQLLAATCVMRNAK